MERSIFEGKQILAVNDDPEVLQVLGKEILEVCPNCRFDKATTYIQAVEKMVSLTYDLVILETIGVHWFDLLNLAVMRNFPVAMLTSNPNPDALKRSIEMGTRAYLPKDKLGEAVPLLEDVLRHQYLPFWRRIFEPLRNLSNTSQRRRLVEVRG